MIIELSGRIDSTNAAETEAGILEQVGSYTGDIQLDASDLEYISSAGLRIILRLKKSNPDTKVIDCSSTVYEIFDMTGFTEMMEISKAYRKLSIEGCEVLGEGSNGIVYRTDPDTIVKVYKNPDSLDEIHNERELARKAFVMGIPTAIPYDVVQVGDLYGSVFELLNAKSFTKLIKAGEDIDDLAKQSVDILRIIHGTELKRGELPDKKEEGVRWAEYCVPHLPDDIGPRLLELVKGIPETNTMLHGDFHTNNIMRQGNENLLIDMDTLSLGHPVFEISQMYLSYRGFSETDHENVKRFLGIDYDTAGKFWESSLRYYFEGRDQAFIDDAVIKSRILGYTRLLRRTLKREPDNAAVIENCRNRLCELVPKVDNLVF